MFERKTIRFCVVCLTYAKYRAAEGGYVEVFGHRVRVERGEPICLDHDARDERGQPMLMTVAVIDEDGVPARSRKLSIEVVAR